MGDVHPPSVRGRAVQVDAAGRRQGRAARRGRAQELEGAALDRYRAVAGVRCTHVPTLNLPTVRGKLEPYTTRPARHFPAAGTPFNRIAYAAAHVVSDPLADAEPWL